MDEIKEIKKLNAIIEKLRADGDRINNEIATTAARLKKLTADLERQKSLPPKHLRFNPGSVLNVK